MKTRNRLEVMAMSAVIGLVLLFGGSRDAHAKNVFGLFNYVRQVETNGQKFEPDSKSTAVVGGAGHQVANLPDIGQGDGGDGGGSLPGLDGFQSMESTTATNTATIDGAIDLLRASRSDVSNADRDSTQSDTGDKGSVGPAIAATGDGNPVVERVKPDGDGMVLVDKVQLDLFVKEAQENKAALEALRAEKGDGVE